MDKLHRLASGGDANDADGGDDLEEAEAEEAEIIGGFARATAVVAKEGLREGLAAGKELELQKVNCLHLLTQTHHTDASLTRLVSLRFVYSGTLLQGISRANFSHRLKFPYSQYRNE